VKFDILGRRKVPECFNDGRRSSAIPPLPMQDIKVQHAFAVIFQHGIKMRCKRGLVSVRWQASNAALYFQLGIYRWIDHVRISSEIGGRVSQRRRTIELAEVTSTCLLSFLLPCHCFTAVLPNRTATQYSSKIPAQNSCHASPLPTTAHAWSAALSGCSPEFNPLFTRCLALTLRI
jgi:hypothetical protein